MQYHRIQKAPFTPDLMWDLTQCHSRQRRGDHPVVQMEKLRFWCVKDPVHWQGTNGRQC